MALLLRIPLNLLATLVATALCAAPASAAIASQGHVAEPAVAPVPTADKGDATVSRTDIAATPTDTTVLGRSAFAPLAQSAPAGAAASVLPGLDQPGLGPSSNSVNPADPGGAIGPEYFLQGVNATGVAVFRRSDLGLVSGPILGASFANAPAGNEVLDSQFIWDDAAQRYFYSFTYKGYLPSGTRTSGILYGWTKTADPTDLSHGWCQMRIDTGADFEDRPKLSTSATHIVLGTNVDPVSANYYSRIWTIPKPANGSTTCPSGTQSGIQSFGSPTQPLRDSANTVVDSPVPAVASDGGSTVYVVAADDTVTPASTIMVWHVNSSGTLVADGRVSVSPYSDPPLAPQPNGLSLDTIDRRLSNAVARTDPDAGAKAVWTQQVIADPSGTGRSVIRWYELIPSQCGSGTCAAGARRQQGEVKDSSTWLFNSAISPTGAGNEAVVHYNSSSSSQAVQIRASSRVFSTALGTMGPAVTVGTSDASARDFTCSDSRPGCRWGDYSTATPDPDDPHVVWGSSQLTQPNTDPNNPPLDWKSRNFAVQASAQPVLGHSATGATDTKPGGDADGVVEPGESVNLSETVRNAGGAGADAITGTLQSLTSGLSISSASSAYPDVAAGGTGTGTSPFRASVGAAIACGTPLAMSLSLDTSEGRYRVPVSVATGRANAQQATTATDVPKAIPDKNATGVSSSVTVAGTGTVADVDVSIARITHPWDGDLQIELIGPDGTRVMLADRPGGIDNAGDNFVNTVFSDDAATPLSSGAAPYTGSFKPQGGRLSAFDGKAVAGTWTLRVADLSEDDTGSLVGWAARTSSAACSVTSNVPPAASFTTAPASPSTGQPVTFTSTSSDPDGTVASQAWDLDNDGQYDDATGATASKTFAKSGTYTVGLKVTDDDGGATTATHTVTVSNRKPAASFSISPNPTSTGQSVTLTSTATDPDGTVASQAWDLDDDGQFDDGGGEGASRTFSTPGSFTVRLRVTDDEGATDTATGTVTIDNRAPTAAFTVAPVSPSTGDDVTFQSTSSDPDGQAIAQAWDLDDDGEFDDGTGPSAHRAFAKAGDYTVRLKVTDTDGKSSVATVVVAVGGRPPVASFTADPETVVTGETVSFDAGGSSDPDGSVERYQWDLDGDGSYETDTGHSATTSRFYGDPGNVAVGLLVTDDDGKTAEAHRTVTVEQAPPFADGPGVPPPSSGPLPGTTDPQPPGTVPDDPPKPVAPHGSLRIVSTRLAAALSRGLAVRFSTDQAATTSLRITIGATAARRLRLGRSAVQVGAGTKLAGKGRASGRIKFSRLARRRLAADRTRGPIRITVKMALIGATGATRHYTAVARLTR